MGSAVRSVCAARGAHSDGIRHQRNISRLSWIDRGEEEEGDVEIPSVGKNGDAFMFPYLDGKRRKRISEIPVLCTCVCLTGKQVL